MFGLVFLSLKGKKLGKKFGDVEKSMREITLKGEPLLIPISVQALFSVSWFTVRAVKHCSRLPREVCRFSICGDTADMPGCGFGHPALADPA